MSSCRGPAGGTGPRAGAAAAPPEVVIGVGVGGSGTAGACGSGSRMSAPSPRPNAFLGIGDYLLGKLRIPLSALTVYIIENNRLTETRCFCEANIPSNNALKDLGAEETPQIGGDLPGKGCALVIHG